MATDNERKFEFPAFDDLPSIDGAPKGCLWGFYDRDGVKDEVGSINLLTPTVVQAAASSEIRTGRHIQLDWPLHSLSYPGFGRKEFEHKVISLHDGLDIYGFDDELHINTQSGSQWDGLKHHASQEHAVFYNGLKFDDALKTDANGIHNWCNRGGIVGRGILVDIRAANWSSDIKPRYYEYKKKVLPSGFSRYEIPVQDIQDALAYQGTKPRQADILLVRTGFIREHNAASDEERLTATRKVGRTIGVKACEETVRWLYSQHFAGLVGDTVAFEAWPPEKDNQWVLHEWALTWWGTPIGEMWDLEALAVECERQNRWSFFVTSAPLRVQGGIASPPCAIAIF
ncbi:conserved hypothetical protein [Talaromyces stipitatus ATCC 10500]|uniref:Cyclase n=1 Tax=Talaromyces stipitatus (strain ATCC 10500 / CBS 375.48 / QM 6759 / NRRL 1006) TaxID=441959 RepID=B8MHF6_TALSN|nr:uncharacterized protein TSTA_021920 [Talaromyces stipitatus ATCC 10500]EED17135.1 conserved hypothetical protein [Talaromyces stipitatus ATCC 10500]